MKTKVKLYLSLSIMLLRCGGDLAITTALDEAQWSGSCYQLYFQGKIPHYQLNSGLCGPQGWSGFGAKRKIPASTGN
jgi:hypothetical protein